MDSIKVILFLTIAIIIVVINVENANADVIYARCKLVLNSRGMNEAMTSSEIFEQFFYHISSISSHNYTEVQADVITRYRKNIYYTIMSLLNESSILSPKKWCIENSIDEKQKLSCNEYNKKLFLLEYDGRYALRNVFFNWTKSGINNLSKHVRDYTTYIFETVKTLIDSKSKLLQSSSQNCSDKMIPYIEQERLLQSPSQFCSNQKKPTITQEELNQLTKSDLGADSSTNLDVKNTFEHVGETSREEPNVTLSTIYDLNLTIDENEKILKKKSSSKKTKMT